MERRRRARGRGRARTPRQGARGPEGPARERRPRGTRGSAAALLRSEWGRPGVSPRVLSRPPSRPPAGGDPVPSCPPPPAWTDPEALFDPDAAKEDAGGPCTCPGGRGERDLRPERRDRRGPPGGSDGGHGGLHRARSRGAGPPAPPDRLLAQPGQDQVTHRGAAPRDPARKGSVIPEEPVPLCQLRGGGGPRHRCPTLQLRLFPEPLLPAERCPSRDCPVLPPRGAVPTPGTPGRAHSSLPPWEGGCCAHPHGPQAWVSAGPELTLPLEEPWA